MAEGSFIEPLVLTLKLAIATTLILTIAGIPLAYWLAHSKIRWKHVLISLITLPIVLPPSVLGFYLLVALSPAGFLGGLIERLFDIRLVFSFEGLVVASVIYSLPFMVNPLLSGFESIPPSLREASYTLGKSSLRTLVSVLLPTIRPSLLTALILTFAHTVGEFGVVLMIGGNIPGETRVASIAIYHEVESLQYSDANLYSLILILFSFVILLGVSLINRRAVIPF